ncbi:sulfurtransferase [Bacillus shivajii]|uniref:sulfurtransferase n=1 Tax=Bacillus shivajii TaxID=1983719 RepID=UPI001CFB442C|nr:sulfurtransferase [Bacillus shivajii]UCZ51398.1 sulfurtransferase [Bacillus shivajii]
MSTNIVSTDWLNENLNNHDLVIVDCRFHLGNPSRGYEEYKIEHIPGAIYLDLEKDLSAPISTHGGRHPLPDIENMIETFSQSGIHPTKHVIAYDDQGGAMASRLWWMLKFLGHQNVAIINEGFSSWKKKGYETTKDIPKVNLVNFDADVQRDMLVTKDDVKAKIYDRNVIMVDSRSKERYLGEKEEVDPIAGHIPGAVNEDWQNRLSSTGVWKQDEELIQELATLNQANKEVIVYCGSGVTACVNVLALEEIGKKSKLYAGSWSDWITYEDTPIAKGPEQKGIEKNR